MLAKRLLRSKNTGGKNGCDFVRMLLLFNIGVHPFCVKITQHLHLHLSFLQLAEENSFW
jgi:hypothetical protein